MMARAASSSDRSQASEPATPLPPVAPAGASRTSLLVVGGGALVILLIVASFIVRTVPPAPVNMPADTASYVARPNPPYGHLQSNGLTKETNDFLQQLSRQPPADSERRFSPTGSRPLTTTSRSAASGTGPRREAVARLFFRSDGG
jgi:hypothetical protein